MRVGDVIMRRVVAESQATTKGLVGRVTVLGRYRPPHLALKCSDTRSSLISIYIALRSRGSSSEEGQDMHKTN